MGGGRAPREGGKTPSPRAGGARGGGLLQGNLVLTTPRQALPFRKLANTPPSP